MIATGDQDLSSFKINYQYIDRDPSSLSERERSQQNKLILQEGDGGSALFGVVTLVVLTLLIAVVLVSCNCLINQQRKRAMTKIKMIQSSESPKKKGHKGANEAAE